MEQEKFIYKVLDVKVKYRKTGQKLKIRGSEDLGKILNKMIGQSSREHFVVVGLDNKLNVTFVYTAHIGTLNASLYHPRDVFSVALQMQARGIVIAHNHPSMELIPSSEDIEMSKQFVKAGELLNIDVFDSLIVNDKEVYSMRDNGDI